MRALIFILFIVIASSALHAQETKPIVLRARVIDSDTVPMITLREVEIFTLEIPKTRRQQRRLTKLVKNIKAVYPYAKLAGIKLSNYEDMLLAAKNDRERKKIMKQAEEEIKEEYGEELKNLTFSQGKILIKLLDRETGNTSYVLVQELRGKFTAFWYQAFARIWGYNLKSEYDPEGEDRQIEVIVKMIERGQI
jgi:hypothetical protein